MPKGWILLVEDNEDDALLTLRALGKSAPQHQVLVARDGAEALEILFEGGHERDGLKDMPGLVLLDINMPRLGGLEVLDHIRRDERCRLTRVVMLTTSDEERDVRRAYELGANSYVRKPVGSEAFRGCVQELCTYWLTLNQLPPQEPSRAETPC